MQTHHWVAVGLGIVGAGYLQAGLVVGELDLYGFGFYVIALGMLAAGLAAWRRAEWLLVGTVATAAVGALLVVVAGLNDGMGAIFAAHLLVALGCLGTLGAAVAQARSGLARPSPWGWAVLLGSAGGLWYGVYELSIRYYDFQFADWAIVLGFALVAGALLRRVQRGPRSLPTPSPR